MGASSERPPPDPAPPTQAGAAAEGSALPHEGELADADAIGDSGSMRSGPGVRITLRVDAAGVVCDARFRVVGFDQARSPASALCDVMIGATLADVGRVSAAALARLAGLSGVSHAVRTVHFAKCAALSPFLGRAAMSGPGVVCVCFGITGDEIRAVIRAHGCRTVEDVKRHLPASQGCGTCRPDIEKLIRD